MLSKGPGLMIKTRRTTGAHPAEAGVRCPRERLQLAWLLHTLRARHTFIH